MDQQPQSVLDYNGEDIHTIFLVWNFKENTEISSSFKAVCALLLNLNNSAYIRFPKRGVSNIMGIGYEAWKRLDLPKPLPKELANFEPIIGDPHTAVATRADLHFHIKGNTKSICYDMAAEISSLLTPVAECVVEVHGFRYWDGRSILGFVDGTENPNGEKERAYYGLIGKEDPAYQNGSYLFVQKYIHDLNAFKALPISEQEKVFGRSRDNDVEMPEDIKPKNAHIALTDVGDDLKIIRDNLPFGNMATNEMGTYFIAYASTFSTVKKMLDNMFIGDPPGNYDRLLDFSTAKTGSLFYVPTLDQLDDFSSDQEKDQDEKAAPNTVEEKETQPPDHTGSLKIGALKTYKKE